MEERKKKLIVLTAEFPLGNAETFLESEFPFLEQHFDSIVFIPTSLSNKAKISRINSTKSQIIQFVENPNKSNILVILKSIFSLVFLNELFFISLYYKQVPKLKIIKTMIQSLMFSNQLSKIINAEIINSKDDISVYSYWSNNTAVALAQIKTKFPQINAITRFHGWDLYFERSGINYLPFRKLIIDKIDSLVFISDNGYTYFKQKFPFCPDTKLCISKLGIPANNQLTHLQRDVFRIATCSLIYPNKQVQLIAESLSKINHLKIEWVHFGAGFQPQYETELKEICSRLFDSKQNISCKLMGHIPNNEVIQYYQSNHISLFINVSISEGLPVSIMEALSCGIPVLAPNIGGISEIVDNKNGVLMDKLVKIDQLTQLIELFYNMSEAELINYRTAAFETWQNKFNAEKNFTDFINNSFDTSTILGCKKSKSKTQHN